MDEDVIYVLVNGECRTYTKLLRRVTEKFGYGYPDRQDTLTDIIDRRLPRGGMLIFDHAHLLQRRILEQLAVFPDELGIALAFIGNAAGYKALVDAKLAQLFARVGGARVIIEMPGEDDVDALLESWGVAGRKEREFCHLIGRQDGGLHHLSETIREARRICAVAGGERIDVRMLKIGAMNAGCWGGEA